MKVELYQSGPGVFVVRSVSGANRGCVIRTLLPSEGLWIKDVRFDVDNELRLRQLATGKLNLHAFVRGELIEAPGTELEGRLILIDYRPRFSHYFFRRDTLAPLSAAGSVAVAHGELWALDPVETGSIYVKLKDRQR